MKSVMNIFSGWVFIKILADISHNNLLGIVRQGLMIMISIRVKVFRNLVH